MLHGGEHENQFRHKNSNCSNFMLTISEASRYTCEIQWEGLKEGISVSIYSTLMHIIL